MMNSKLKVTFALLYGISFVSLLSQMRGLVTAGDVVAVSIVAFVPAVLWFAVAGVIGAAVERIWHKI